MKLLFRPVHSYFLSTVFSVALTLLRNIKIVLQNINKSFENNNRSFANLLNRLIYFYGLISVTDFLIIIFFIFSKVYLQKQLLTLY